MVFKYEVFSGTKIILEGSMYANDLREAQSKVFQKLKGKNKSELSIKINDQITLKGSSIFEPPVLKKLQTRPLAPWK